MEAGLPCQAAHTSGLPLGQKPQRRASASGHEGESAGLPSSPRIPQRRGLGTATYVLTVCLPMPGCRMPSGAQSHPARHRLPTGMCQEGFPRFQL